MRFFGRIVLAMLAAALPVAAQGQTAMRADWTNLNRVNFEAVTTGTVLPVGPNSVTITSQRVTDGDANNAAFVPYYSTDFLSYYTGTIGTQTGPLLYSMDHSVFDAGDYFETTFTLATAVQSLAFTVANVDRLFDTIRWHDAVVIEYDTGTGTWLNLRSLPAAYTLGANVGTTTINGQQGFHGTNYTASLTSPNADIRVAFGAAVTVKRVRIRYYFGQLNPAMDPSGDSQFISLSDFTWTQAGVNSSDLSLSGSVSNATPAIGSTLTYTVNVTNAGPQAATGVSVTDRLPAGFTYTSSTVTSGSFNPATGVWSGISIPSGGTRTLTITGTINAPAGVVQANVAEVTTSPNYDPDSTPGNGMAGEDDQLTQNVTMAGTRSTSPGVPPSFSCPSGSSLFEWNLVSWPAGSLSNSYALANIGQIGFNVAANGAWVSDAAFGGMSPSLSNANNGGIAGTRPSLHQYLDFADRSQTATTTITLPTAVPGARFTVFDIDYAVNDFADKLTVTGSYRGNTVIPTLTNGVSNYVIGNVAVGDGASAATSGNGNVIVTFSQPIDTITIVYGNANTAPVNPDGQAIAIYDITFCNPVAVLNVTKVSTLISDPVNGTTNPRAIPGAVMEYCISVQNPGSGTATGVVGTDTIPATLTYTPGSMLTGANCASATTAEDDNAAGADETDPHGGSITGAVLSATAPTLAPTEGFALKFRTTAK